MTLDQHQNDTTDRLLDLSRYNYDEFADGICIILILKAAKKYSGYDIEPIKQQIHEKMLWLILKTESFCKKYGWAKDCRTCNQIGEYQLWDKKDKLNKE
jgi:hypothetical protein